ncbi:MAG TPA: glycosyltransferase family 2 protein [Bacteroidales bacterium]|nr:glycosyltransferase family 2 protein [Bacteroidales bacterium]
MSTHPLYSRIKELGIVVLVPTYNNYKTVTQVIDSLLVYTPDIIVINDGATDSTPQLLQAYSDKVTVLSYYPNKGKGNALITGFKKAMEMGFSYAITIDSDGQHFADDLELFVEEIEKYPHALIVGSRLLKQENMPGGNTFANKFSNFWFRVQTGIAMPDTQSGYRLYPLKKMGSMKLWTKRYEAELEMLVFSAWRGIRLRAIKIKVFYASKEERVSHFRPYHDFIRIGLLNSVLVFLAVVYGYPSMAIRRLFKK